MSSRLALYGIALLLAAGGCGGDDPPAAAAPRPPVPPSEPARPPERIPVAEQPFNFGPAERPQAEPEDVAAAVKGSSRFALDLYAKLTADRPGENVFFAPFGISTTLSMACGGANGKTADEMRQMLRMGLAYEQIHRAMGVLLFDLSKWQQQSSARLVVTNSLWSQKGAPLLPEFLALGKDNYGAAPGLLNFITDPEGARKAINAWAAGATRDRVLEPVPSRAVNELTRLALVSAVYFRGRWEEEFRPGATKDEPFKLGGGRSAKVPMMKLEGSFRFFEDPSLQALELPYRGRKLVMLFILPRDDEGLRTLEGSLEPAMFDPASLREEHVIIAIPRCRIAAEYRLNRALQALGMTEAFDRDKADFSGVNGIRQPADEALHVSTVMHKTFVDVDERGTEAAASTGVYEAAKSAESPEKLKPRTFTADHPFIFLIRDRETGVILFLGRVTNPAPGAPETPAPEPKK